MNKITSGLFLIAAGLAQSSVANASSLYDFSSTLNDTTGAGPAMIGLGGALNAGFYNFGVNQGLTLNASSFDAANYDITLRFSFVDVSPTTIWRKILDFNALTTDEGLYAFNDHLQFVETTASNGVENLINGPAGTFVANQLLDLHLIRDGATQQFTASINNQQQFSFQDTKGKAIFVFNSNPPVATFFVDDAVTSGTESSAGRVDFIRIGAAPVPLPPAFALLAPALGLMGWRGRKDKRWLPARLGACEANETRALLRT